MTCTHTRITWPHLLLLSGTRISVFSYSWHYSNVQTTFFLRDFRLPPRSRWDLRSYGLFTQRRVVIPYWCFGKNYRSQLQGSRSPIWILLVPWPLKMGPRGCPETSVWNYPPPNTMCNIPEDSIYQPLPFILNKNFQIKLVSWRNSAW